MAVRRSSGGFLVAFLLASANLVCERKVAEALAGAPMELTSQALAQTPASAEAPASGAGPFITRSNPLRESLFFCTVHSGSIVSFCHGSFNAALLARACRKGLKSLVV